MTLRSLSFLMATALLISSCSKGSKEETPPGPDPVIKLESVSPLKGFPGDTLTITGTNFGTATEDVTVYFPGGKTNIPFEVTPNRLKVKVPEGIITGMITLSVKGVYANDNLRFEIKPVAQLSLFPGEARPGEIIEVHSIFNGSDPATIEVKFNGSATWTSILRMKTQNVAQVRVPSDASTGKVQLRANYLAPGLSNNAFKVLPASPPMKTGSWVQRGSLDGSNSEGSGKAGAFCFVVKEKAYIGGGSTLAPLDGFGSKELWEYDPEYDTWMQKADYGGGAKVYAVAFALNGKGYVGTGLSASTVSSKDFWEYDATTNAWTKKADFPGSSRGYATGFALGDHGYVGSGFSATQSEADFYRYDPSTNVWSPVASIPVARNRAFAFAADNKGYVGGGAVNSDGTMARREFYQYNPDLNTWTTKSWLPDNYNFSCLNATATIDGKGYVGLGHQASNAPIRVLGTDLVYEYNPATDTWKSLPKFGGSQRSAAIGFSIGNALYFGLGQAHGRSHAYDNLWGFMVK